MPFLSGASKIETAPETGSEVPCGKVFRDYKKRKYCEYADCKHKMPENKELKLPKREPKKYNRGWLLTEYQKAREIAELMGRFDVRDGLDLGWHLGLRIIEACQLKVKDVRSALKVNGPDIKGKGGQVRFVKIETEEQLELLKHLYREAKAKGLTDDDFIISKTIYKSSGMDMMPIMNVFNEWHAANTSKKIRAVIESNAKAGKYRACYAPYGYVKGEDENRLPVRDEPAASNVHRMFEMRARGISPNKIAQTFNEEGIPIPSDYKEEKFGIPNTRQSHHLWSCSTVKQIITNVQFEDAKTEFDRVMEA